MDLQLIPIPSLDFQVALNLGETAPLSFQILMVNVSFSCSFQLTMVGQKVNACTLTQKAHLDPRDYLLLRKGMLHFLQCMCLKINLRKRIKLLMACTVL